MGNVSFPRDVELDAVTGLPPRKVLDHDLPVLLRSLGTEGLPMCSIMIDIDHFKKFNDTYGHSIGDLVLKHVSGIIRGIVRYRGEAYRYGGEEIVVLLLNTSAGEGLATAQRICEEVGTSEVEAVVGGENQFLSVRVSVGVASTDQVSGSELLVSSDQALYNAKEQGRDRAVLYSKPDGMQLSATTKIDVHFPGRTQIAVGSYLLLKQWFSLDNPTEIEAREIKDPNDDISEVADGPVPMYGLIKAEIRGKVGEIWRRGNHTFFTLEVKNETIDLMFKYIMDRLNEYAED